VHELIQSISRDSSRTMWDSFARCSGYAKLHKQTWFVLYMYLELCQILHDQRDYSCQPRAHPSHPSQVYPPTASRTSRGKGALWLASSASSSGSSSSTACRPRAPTEPNDQGRGDDGRGEVVESTLSVELPESKPTWASQTKSLGQQFSPECCISRPVARE
jgi:hypothetical protein